MLQPLDEWIISSPKCRYRRRQIKRALDLTNLAKTNIYAIDQLQAMRCICAEWSTMPSEVIANSWIYTKLCIAPDSDSSEPTAQTGDHQTLLLQEEIERVGSDF